LFADLRSPRYFARKLTDNCSYHFIWVGERHGGTGNFIKPKIIIMKPAHFIIVDDDAINNRLCQLSIARHFGPVQIESFQNPLLALDTIAAIANNERSKVLFLDIHMPQMNGWEFLDHFSRFDKTVQNQFKIYILSSSSAADEIDRAWKHPLVAGFISKPLGEKKLEKIFRELPEEFGMTCFY
jgi:CheY-like chemotaxis protein